MSTTVKIGWLKDNNGEKFAPKTLSSQVQTSDGTLFEDKIQADLDSLKSEIKTDLENIDLSEYETTESAQLKLDEAKSYADTKTFGLASTEYVDTAIADITAIPTAEIDEICGAV